MALLHPLIIYLKISWLRTISHAHFPHFARVIGFPLELLGTTLGRDMAKRQDEPTYPPRCEFYDAKGEAKPGLDRREVIIRTRKAGED